MPEFGVEEEKKKNSTRYNITWKPIPGDEPEYLRKVGLAVDVANGYVTSASQTPQEYLKDEFIEKAKGSLSKQIPPEAASTLVEAAKTGNTEVIIRYQQGEIYQSEE